MTVDFDTAVKLAIYRHFAETGERPDAETLANVVGTSADEIRSAFGRLRRSRVLYLEPDGETIRMAPPFSGVPTQHVVEAAGTRYFANCAWDGLGIVAALKSGGTVRSRCEQTHEPLELHVGADGPAESDWIFHCLVPAAHWWDDIVFT